jgi:putative flavoprotein involved in K+ transport
MISLYALEKEFFTLNKNQMVINSKRNWNTIIIGGGQAGLATGYYLKNAQDDFVILDASDRIGDSWRNRWDSLKLFTPNWANSLPGHKFPAPGKIHAGKDEVADFLDFYARKFELPVLLQAKVTDVTKKEEIYEVQSSRGIFTCKNIVIANGGYAIPKKPGFSSGLSDEIRQLHSSMYQRASDLPVGDVLVVGAGTSGLQIAMDIAASKRKTYVSGTPTFKIPEFILKYFGKQFVWVMNNIITIKTKPGRKAQKAIKSGAGAPLINISMEDAEKAGVKHVSRIKGVREGYPILEDGTAIKVSTVIWCTGFSCDVSWINLNDITDDHGYPLSYRGISPTHEGLYFVGMPFQYALTSTWINGAGRDANYIADHIHHKRPVPTRPSTIKARMSYEP